MNSVKPSMMPSKTTASQSGMAWLDAKRSGKASGKMTPLAFARHQTGPTDEMTPTDEKDPPMKNTNGSKRPTDEKDQRIKNTNG
ncbi:MAG: hypothetical protein N3I86_00530 [Verrucomicrobiae bacterium]|nr:hypothetical protein [Verrucomicrobiae bacterium]